MVTGKGSVYSSKIANGVFGNAKKEKEKDVWVIVFTVTHHWTQDYFRKLLMEV